MTLAIGVPQGGMATYESADTTVIAVDAGGQILEIPAVSMARMNVAFEATMDGGVRASATWTDYEATMSNPMGPSERATLDGVEGTLVFDLDRMGDVSIVELPSLSGTAETMLTPEGVAYGLFPGMPGVPPQPGTTWTDTISYVVDRAGTYTESTEVYEWTVVGEEQYEGRTVLRLNFTNSMTMEQDGVQMGMSFSQNLQGGAEGYVLWDLTANRMELRQSSGSLEGVMDMDQMPMPLPLSVSNSSTIRRVAGGM